MSHDVLDNPFGSGEQAPPPVTLESQMQAYYTPSADLWPLMMHRPGIRTAAQYALPHMVHNLSTPVSTANAFEVQGIFAEAPHGVPEESWAYDEGPDGAYGYSSPVYFGDDGEGLNARDGHRYTFDGNGRITGYALTAGGWSSDRGRATYTEHFVYDDDGYLLQRATCDFGHTRVDEFTYANRNDGRRVPALMTRRVTTSGQSEYSKPMTVDLTNVSRWIAENPNGLQALSKAEVGERPLDLSNFTVEEKRSGILFSSPDEVEMALIRLGTGDHGTGNAALAQTAEDMIQAGQGSGAELLGDLSLNVDIPQFVRDQLMPQIVTAWNKVQQSRKQNASQEVEFNFDYSGPAGFHKSVTRVRISKDGLELRTSAAYVGDQTEDALALAMGKSRGLRDATIDIPVNQAMRDGHFLVDVAAACRQLGITISPEALQSYFKQKTGTETPKERRQREKAQGNDRPGVLWQDAELAKQGIRVTLDLATRQADYETRTDLDTYFRTDSAAIWGPMPRQIIPWNAAHNDGTPHLRLTVSAEGNRFDEATATKTDAVVNDYMRRLMPAA